MCHIRGFRILLKSQLFVIQTWASCYANTPHSFEDDRTSTEDAAMLMWNLEPKWKKDQKGKKTAVKTLHMQKVNAVLAVYQKLSHLQVLNCTVFVVVVVVRLFFIIIS